MILGYNSLHGPRQHICLFLHWEARVSLGVQRMKCLFDSADLPRTTRPLNKGIWKVFFHHEKYIQDYRNYDFWEGTFMAKFWSWHGWSLHPPPDIIVYFSCLIIQRPFPETVLCSCTTLSNDNTDIRSTYFLSLSWILVSRWKFGHKCH